MAAVSKVIQLPIPIQRRPATAFWGLQQITLNTFSKTATALFVAVSEKGEMVPGGDTLSRSVSGSDYDAAVEPLEAAVMQQLLGLLKAASQVDSNAAVVDAKG